MPSYHLVWEIDLDADSPREAALQARAIQRRRDSTATVFDVIQHDGEQAVRVDLDADDDTDDSTPAPDPIVFLPTSVPGSDAASPRYLALKVSQTLIDTIARLLGVLEANHIQQTAAAYTPDYWEDNDAWEMRSEYLNVDRNGFWFSAFPKRSSAMVVSDQHQIKHLLQRVTDGARDFVELDELQIDDLQQRGLMAATN